MASSEKKFEELEQKELEWAVEKEILKREQTIEREKKAFTKKKGMSTSKKLILFLFINCALIEIFTGWAMVQMLNLVSTNGTMIDFSPLITLIGAVVGEVIGYSVYCLKAAKENSVGGIVYDAAMKKDNTVG